MLEIADRAEVRTAIAVRLTHPTQWAPGVHHPPGCNGPAPRTPTTHHRQQTSGVRREPSGTARYTGIVALHSPDNKNQYCQMFPP